jgi:hypothetical protein
MPHVDLHEARDLLGLEEIMLRRLGEALAFQRHDALIAMRLLSPTRRLIDGDGEIALAEQAEQGRVRALLGELVGIELNIAAQAAPPPWAI